MIKILDRIEDVFSVVAFFLATLLIFMNVVLRFIGHGTTWSEELIRYLIIWLTFIGSSICVRKNEHVSVDLLPEFLPEFWKKILFIVVNVIAIIFLLFITKYSIDLIAFSVQTGQISPALGIPMFTVYLILPIGFILMALRYLVSSINHVKDLTVSR